MAGAGDIWGIEKGGNARREIERLKAEADPLSQYVTDEEAAALVSGSVTLEHFTGSQGTAQTGNVKRFTLSVTPTGVNIVDVDGMLFYRGQSPGFTWSSGSRNVDIDIGQALPSYAKVHIHRF